MTARNDILRLMSQYCFTIDTGNMEAWAELFEPRSRRSRSAPMKQNCEAPYLLRAVGNQLKIDGDRIPHTLLILTPNAPMSGAVARSAEASAPLAG